MKLFRKFPLHWTVIFLAGLLLSQASAASLRKDILSDVSISREKQNIAVRVSFNFPVRYLRHFPSDSARELNIQVDPILSAVDDPAILRIHGTYSVPDNNPAGLDRIEYEGDAVAEPTIRLVFTDVVQYTVSQGDDFRSLLIELPIQEQRQDEVAQQSARTSSARQPAGKMTSQRQQELQDAAEQAMADEDYMRAILIYTELLDAPDPQVREAAQFQLALARERNGHLAHARAEYANYLEDYPEGENGGEARRRLDALMETRPAGQGAGQLAEGWQNRYFGSVYMYYNRDESLYDNRDDIVNLSSLITGLDFTWRSTAANIKTEAVAIGSYEQSFIDRRDNRVRTDRLYLDIADRDETLTARVGRQSSSKGGVLAARFDGARFGFRLAEKIRLNAVGGFPVNLSYDGLDTDRYFYGINLDLGRFADHWEFNTYFINQVADDVDDRRAIGGEVRFLASRASFYSMLDYDILYDDVSLFLLTGNYLLANNKTRFNFMADFRGTPILTTSNAMIGQTSPSLETLEETLGEDEVRRLARDRTLDTSFVNLGISHNLTDYLQVAGDVSWSTIDDAPASGGVPAFESTGDDFFYSLQLIGSSLFRQGDISSIGLRYADTLYRDTTSVLLNYRFLPTDALLVNPRLQIDYRENQILSGDQWRFIPRLRFEYTLARNWRFEADGEYRYADEELEGLADGKNGYAFTIGLRWDF